MKKNKLTVHILTGFLGSGKTTILRDFLNNEDKEKLKKTAIIINEVGEIGIDHLILDKPKEDISILENGCLCCETNNELKLSLKRILAINGSNIETVIIETTGLANISPIINSIFNDRELILTFKMGKIITIIDTKNYQESKLNSPEWTNQVVSSDQIVLTKHEEKNNIKINEIKEQISKINPTTEISLKNKNSLSYCIERKNQKIQNKNQVFYSITKDNHSKINTVSINTKHIDWKKFSIWLSMLLYKHQGKILRIKAILKSMNSDEYLLFNSVQSAVAPIEKIERKDINNNQLGLVFIVKDIDTKKITESFSNFHISVEK